MIRSTEISWKFSNTNKKDAIIEFIQEYRRVAGFFCNTLWDMAKCPTLLPKELTDSVGSWLSARALQACAKQVSGVIRGTRKKQEKRLFMLQKLMKEGKNTKALQRKISKAVISKPNVSRMNPELDQRFVSFDEDPKTSFNLWATLGSIGRSIKIKIPLKKTNHFKKWRSRGDLKQCVRLTDSSAILMFDIPDAQEKTTGNIVGLDIGELNVFTVSDRQTTSPDKDGWTLDKITKKLARRKKGSKGFREAQTHRKNYIHWCFNKLDLSDVKQINAEDIKNLRYKSRSSRRLSHWTYTIIFDKLKSYCFEAGVLVLQRSSVYSSQRCSSCGWTRKRNRKGKVFSCKACGFTDDADYNASLNLSSVLPEISPEIRQKRYNLAGFYWKPDGLYFDGGEPIVPHVQKP